MTSTLISSKSYANLVDDAISDPDAMTAYLKDSAGTLSVSNADTHIKNLEDALSAGTSITIAKLNSGANEQLQISLASHTHSASDVTSGVLDNTRVNWASPGALGATTASTLRGTTLALTSTNNVLSALIPNADNTLDLGSATNRWRELFTNEITLTQTSTATTGSFQPFTVTSTFSPASDYTQVPTNLQNTFTIGASGNQLTSDVV